MGWRFPPKPLLSATPLDVDDVNEDFLAFVHEMQGHLGEQNIAASAFADPLNPNEAPPPDIHAWHQNGKEATDIASTTNTANFGPSLAWVQVPDTGVSFVSPPCVLAIWGSLQIQILTTLPGQSPGPTVAIRVDGVPIVESIVGGVEEQNDPTGALYYATWPVATSAAVPVAGGSHTVDLAIRTFGTGSWRFLVHGREIAVLEMRRALPL